jgi:hypothetical protein
MELAKASDDLGQITRDSLNEFKPILLLSGDIHAPILNILVEHLG